MTNEIKKHQAYKLIGILSLLNRDTHPVLQFNQLVTFFRIRFHFEDLISMCLLI